ncbi:MAG: HAD family hydrolase [Bdellovibrionales bacterium]|nr:HAD family hydrolase [Bdellovibrionales bacterium]
MNNAHEILQFIIKRCEHLKQNGRPPLLAVFDLDSTLFDVSPRTKAIFQSLASHPETKRRFPEESSVLSQLQPLPEDWGIKATLQRSQIRATLDFFEAVRLFWVENFFSDRYLHFDRLYDGALEFVQQLSEAGATIKYLTGRDHERMGAGTLAAIKASQLPLANESTHLILKPHRNLDDARYKTDNLKALSDRYPEIWFFENEPTIIKLVRVELPNVKVIFVDTVHSGQNEAPTGLPSIKKSFRK